MNGLVDQSPSVSCSVVGTVPGLSSKSKQFNYLALKTSRRFINLWCDETPYHLVSLTHEKGCLLTAQPLIARIKKGKLSIILERPPNLLRQNLKTETPLPPHKPPTSPKCGKWEGWLCCYKEPGGVSLFFTQQLHISILPSLHYRLLPSSSSAPPIPQSLVQSFLCKRNGEERLEEKGRDDGQGVEEIPEHHEVPQ